MKHDWPALCREFMELSDTSTAARKAFCSERELNDNSFRRELGKYKKTLADKSDSDKSSKEPSKAPAQKSSNKSDDKPKTKKKSKAKLAAEKQREEATHKPVGKGVLKDKELVTRATVDEKWKENNTTATNIYDESGKRSFRKNHQAGLIHGGYANRVFGHDDEQHAFARINIGDTLTLIARKLGSMESIVQRKKEAIAEIYDEGRTLFREVLDPATGESEKFPMSFEEACLDAELSGADAFEKLAGKFISGYEKLHKMELSEHGAPVLSKVQEAKLVQQIFKKRVDDDLSATDTCYLFYAEGITPPSLLAKEAEIEMRNAEDIIDDNAGGVTEEEMQRAREEALAKRADTENEIARIKERNERIRLGSGKGVGDVVVDERGAE